MPVLWIPPDMRDLTKGKDRIRVTGINVRQALAYLDAVYPGVRNLLCEGNDLSPNFTVVVDGEGSPMRMHTPLKEDSEVHFLPAMEGG